VGSHSTGLTKKILLIRFSSIGDIVLTSPVIRCLREQTDAEVHFLTKPAFADLALANPHISKVIVLSEKVSQTISALRKENYDHVIDLHHNLRSKRIKLALGKKAKSFKKLNFEKWLMVNFKINRLPDVHIVDRYLQTVVFLGVENDQKGLDFFIPEEKKFDLSTVGIPAKKFAAVVVGAAHPTKCMTSDQIAVLCQLLDLPVVLLGGKQEWDKAESIIVKSGNTNIFNACGKLDIFQSASVLQQAQTIVSHDTGLMHIAAALKKPQVVVWGNTIPKFGMYPYYDDLSIQWKSFGIDDLYCRPCSKIGFEKCPEGHFRCMLDHDMNAVARAALSLIAEEKISPAS
jgi:ADP-heptose:LPS heptosyltransferase